MVSEKQYQAITASIIKSLERGTVPWKKPWKAPRHGHNPNMPFNGSTGKNYKGLNILSLWAEAAEHGFESNAWLTYRQAVNLKGNVRKGERSTTLHFWKAPERTVEVDDTTGEVVKHSGRWLLVMFRVFNLEQCDGVVLPKRAADISDDAEPFDVIQLAEGVVDGYITNDGPSLSFGGGSAYYRPSADAVQMPELRQFNAPEGFYSTLYHELGHSTGHTSRLDRLDQDVKLAAFGSEDYSAEELVAELTSAFLCAETGIDNTLENSAAYIASWLKVLKNDLGMVQQAASKAQKASVLILEASVAEGVGA